MIREDYSGTLADGTQFNWNKLTETYGGKKGIGALNFDDPIIAHAVSQADMLATAQGLTGKARQNIAAEMAKAAALNANGDIRVVDENIRTFAAQLGLKPEDIHHNINVVAERELKSSSEEEERTFAVAKANASRIFGNPPQIPTTPDKQTAAVIAQGAAPAPRPTGANVQASVQNKPNTGIINLNTRRR
jgi:hypothetical protein